jgi:ABC-2 type transport system ATP-binding protein
VSIIEARGLARVFATKQGQVEAVRGVDFSVEAGEIVGFLGPNGAGKTTTLRMLTTLIKPTSGSATVVGCDLLADPQGVRERIGYVSQVGGTDPSCPVAEELLLQGELHGLSRAESRRRGEALLDSLDLRAIAMRPAGSLSGGQRRRLDIALGLVHRPPLLFLDEPSTGLDPQSRSHLWDQVRRLRGEHGTTVFLTTHYLDEADALADRLLIIDHGKIVAEGTPAELKRRISGDIVTLEIQGEVERARQAIAAHPEVRSLAGTGSTLRITVDNGERILMELVRVLNETGATLSSVNLARPTLDDVFLTVTGRSLREDAAPAA